MKYTRKPYEIEAVPVADIVRNVTRNVTQNERLPTWVVEAYLDGRLALPATGSFPIVLHGANFGTIEMFLVRRAFTDRHSWGAGATDRSPNGFDLLLRSAEYMANFEAVPS